MAPMPYLSKQQTRSRSTASVVGEMSRTRSFTAALKAPTGHSPLSCVQPQYLSNNGPDQILLPWQTSDQLRHERASRVREVLAPSIAQPKTAKDLADALSKLVFAHDIRRLEQVLQKTLERLQALESAARMNERARLAREQTMTELEKELKAVRILAARSGPDLSEKIGFPAFQKELRSQYSKMTEKVSTLESGISALVQQNQELETKLKAFAAGGSNSEVQSSLPHYVPIRQSQKNEVSPSRNLSSVHTHEKQEEKNLKTTVQHRVQQPTSTKPQTSTNVRPSTSNAPTKPVEHRKHEQNGVTKRSSANSHTPRRMAFTRYVKEIWMKYNEEEPQSAKSQTNFIWSFIDELEDKELSSYIQRHLVESFPEHVSKSKGRGKAYREIKIRNGITFKEVYNYLRRMEAPSFLISK